MITVHACAQSSTALSSGGYFLSVSTQNLAGLIAIWSLIALWTACAVNAFLSVPDRPIPLTSYTPTFGKFLPSCNQENKVLNPFTTNDNYSRHRNSATCYQLAQFVLKIGFALAERVGQGEVGGCITLADSAWQLLQLFMERAWSVLDGPFFCFLVQTS